MYSPDICDETEWFFTAADIDILTAEGIDLDAEFRPADHRDAVQDLWHSLQIGRVNLLDAVIGWDRADATSSTVPALQPHGYATGSEFHMRTPSCSSPKRVGARHPAGSSRTGRWRVVVRPGRPTPPRLHRSAGLICGA